MVSTVATGPAFAAWAAPQASAPAKDDLPVTGHAQRPCLALFGKVICFINGFVCSRSLLACVTCFRAFQPGFFVVVFLVGWRTAKHDLPGSLSGLRTLTIARVSWLSLLRGFFAYTFINHCFLVWLGVHG